MLGQSHQNPWARSHLIGFSQAHRGFALHFGGGLVKIGQGHQFLE